MKEELLSVIVPIYNVAPYLVKCISSICNQSYPSLEIILVDDGSTDESGEICDRYAERDNRIKVIHQRNGRLTRARKAGMRAATGKYVTFVDGDDWIETDMMSVLYKDAIEYNAQIVLSDFYRDNKNGAYIKKTVLKGRKGLYEGEELQEIKNHIRSCLNWACWNKLYEKELVERELEKVDDDLSGIQDDFFSAGSILKSKRIYVEEKAFYHAYDRNDSETHRLHPDYYLMMHRALPYYKEMMTYGNEKVKKELQRTFISGLLVGIENVFPNEFFPRFIFENKCNLNKDNKIILYGAGDVGECFYKQVLNNNSFNIVAWMDSNKEYSSKTRMKLSKSIDFDNFEFDYILIAVLDEAVANSIKDELTKSGVEKKKLLWEKPVLTIDLIGL